MKLNFLSKDALQQQEMTSVKGGKRVFCITAAHQAMLDKAIKLTPKDPSKTNTTMLNISNKGICIQWNRMVCKKP